MMPEIPWDSILETMDHQVQGALPSVSQISRESLDPFLVLISTLLSLRTRDEVTLAASRRLFQKAASPQTILQLSKEELQKLIYPSAFFRNKADQILRICRILEQNYQSRVPPDQKKLMALPGVGLKTANLVLGLAFGIPSICVDIHVHRIANRMGWLSTETPEKTESGLTKILPEKNWIRINEILVAYGQQICTPQSPRCNKCSVKGWCQQIGVTRFR